MAATFYEMPSVLETEKQQTRQIFQDAGVPWEKYGAVFTDAYSGNPVAQNILQRMINDVKSNAPLTRPPGIIIQQQEAKLHSEQPCAAGRRF